MGCFCLSRPENLPDSPPRTKRVTLSFLVVLPLLALRASGKCASRADLTLGGLFLGYRPRRSCKSAGRSALCLRLRSNLRRNTYVLRLPSAEQSVAILEGARRAHNPSERQLNPFGPTAMAIVAVRSAILAERSWLDHDRGA